MVFVFDDISSPFVNVAISALPDLLCDLVDQSEVVRNEDHATVEALDGISKRIDGFDIQVICRFVKKEEVTFLPREPRESDATLQIHARASTFGQLTLCPSDKHPIGVVCCLPVIPYLPTIFRVFSISFISGYS